MSIEEAEELLENNETLHALMDFAGNYDIEINDLAWRSNWGLYKNKPVLVDVGGSSDIIQKYY
jgi:hypothetical protein